MTVKSAKVAWIADSDMGLDWIRDVDRPNDGWWSACGRAYIGKDGFDHHLWVAVPAEWVDDSTLLGDYIGPDALDVQGLARWFPGTTANGHRDNPRSRWYVRLSTERGFKQAKEAATRCICDVSALTDPTWRKATL